MKKFFTSIIAPIFLLTGFNVHSEIASSAPDFQANYLQPTAPQPPKANPPQTYHLPQPPMMMAPSKDEIARSSEPNLQENHIQPTTPYPYPPKAYPPQVYPPQVYPPQVYPPQVYPPQVYPPQTYPPQAYHLPEPPMMMAPSRDELRISHKSSTVAGLLNLAGFLGIGGIGRIYAGSTAMGVGQLLLSFFLPGVGQLWSIIDAAYIFSGAATDSDGRHLVSHPEPFHVTIQPVPHPTIQQIIPQHHYRSAF